MPPPAASAEIEAALAALDAYPALMESQGRLAATAREDGGIRELVATTESDRALAIAVLRLANGPRDIGACSARSAWPSTSWMRPRVGRSDADHASVGASISRRWNLPESLAARLADGLVPKQIATELGLSASTVRNPLHRIYDRIGAADRAQAVLLARDRGWLGAEIGGPCRRRSELAARERAEPFTGSDAPGRASQARSKTTP